MPDVLRPVLRPVLRDVLGRPLTPIKGAGWWLSGSALDLDFANNRAFNRSTGFNGSPNGILTYTSPSQKLVYGNDGVLTYAPYNRLVQSQTFDNAAWTKGNCSVTANAGAAPDGSTTADLIIPAAASAAYKTIQHVDVNVGAAVATASIYAKASGYGFISFVATGSLGRLTIELSSGAYTNYGAALTATSTAVGDGWYRVVIKVPNWTSLAAFWVGPNSAQRDPATAWTSDGVSGAYLWGAQLVAGSSALIYVPTTSAAVYHLPIDHDPITHAPLGVLIEEQRTNLLTYSEQFDNAAWTNTLAGTGTIPTKTANAGVAPDGTTTADRLVLQLNGGTTTSDAARLRQSATTTAAAHTLSVWLKSYDGVSTYSMGIQLSSTATAITVTGEWQRFTLTVTTTAAAQANDIFIRGGQTPTHSGAADILVWGAQLEAGAFATSYIPTISQVTRTADKVMIATSAFGFNATEGTLYTEGRATSTGTAYFAGFSDNGGSDLEYMGNRKSGAGYGANVVDGGAPQASMTTNSPVYAANLEVEIAFAYKANDFATSINGAAVGTGVSGTLPTVTGLYVGAIRDAANYANGCIKRLTYFPTRKTNAELQALSA